MTHPKIQRILAQGMRCRFLPLNTLQECSTDSAHQVWRKLGAGHSSGLKQPTGLSRVSQVTHGVSLLAHRKGWEIKGTKHERSNMFGEFQGRAGVEMTGMAGDGRQTGPFPCLQIYTQPSEQCKATDDFYGEQHSQGRGEGWKNRLRRMLWQWSREQMTWICTEAVAIKGKG